MAEDPRLALREGEQLLAEFSPTEKFQVDLAGTSAAKPGKQAAVNFRLTSERLLWMNPENGSVTALPFEKIKLQETGGGLFRENFLRLNLQSGATVTLRCKNNKELLPLLGVELKRGRRTWIRRQAGVETQEESPLGAAPAGALPRGAAPGPRPEAAPLPPPPPPQPRLSMLEAQSEKLGEEISRLESMMQRCHHNAAQLARRGTPAAKQEALGMLARGKMCEKQREQYLAQQLKIDQLQMNVESAQLTADAVAAMKAGQAQFRSTIQEAPLEEAERLRDEAEDLLEGFQDVSDLLQEDGLRPGEEDELNAEWEMLTAEYAASLPPTQTQAVPYAYAAAAPGTPRRTASSPQAAPQMPGWVARADDDVEARLRAILATPAPRSAPPPPPGRPPAAWSASPEAFQAEQSRAAPLPPPLSPRAAPTSLLAAASTQPPPPPPPSRAPVLSEAEALQALEALMKGAAAYTGPRMSEEEALQTMKAMAGRAPARIAMTA